jgi:hypothetical protein
MSVDAQLDRARLRLHDDLQAEDGLLDPDQPTQTAHLDWQQATFGPIRPDEFTPMQRAAIRLEFDPAR